MPSARWNFAVNALGVVTVAWARGGRSAVAATSDAATAAGLNVVVPPQRRLFGSTTCRVRSRNWSAGHGGVIRTPELNARAYGRGGPPPDERDSGVERVGGHRDQAGVGRRHHGPPLLSHIPMLIPARGASSIPFGAPHLAAPAGRLAHRRLEPRVNVQGAPACRPQRRTPCSGPMLTPAPANSPGNRPTSPCGEPSARHGNGAVSCRSSDS